MSRFFVLFPLVLSLVAFVLSMLCLFAGHKEAFMEDYAIARLNTSMLGHNLLDIDNKDASTQQDDSDEDDGWFDRASDKAKDKWEDLKNDIKEGVNDVTGNVADELAEALGISQWYSIHVMDSCEGLYKPNATSPGAGLNVTNCTTSDPDHRFNLTKILDHELDVGPLSLNPKDLNWPDDIQETIDVLNDALLALFILYVLSVGFSGLAMLACVAALFLAGRGAVVLANLILASLAALTATIGSVLATVAAKKGVSKLNKIGDDIGLSADLGSKFLIITWVAAGFMIAATAYWTASIFLMRREKKRQWKPRKGSY